MAEQASLQLPKDLIEPIINAHIQAALAQAFGGQEKILQKIAQQLLNQPVDYQGKPTNSSYEKKGTWIEVNLQLAFHQAMKDVIAAELEKHKEILKKAMSEQLKKTNSPLVKAMVEGMCNGAVTNGLKYHLQVTEVK